MKKKKLININLQILYKSRINNNFFLFALNFQKQ